MLSDGPMCYDYFSAVRNFLNLPDVKYALGVNPNLTFELCSNTVNGNFQNTGDWMRPYVHQLAGILENGIRVLAFAGDTDFMCNWMGIRAWTMDLAWQGQTSYNNQHDLDWFTTEGTNAGTIKQDTMLTFLRLYNAGHMAPYDQPEATLDMFNRWLLDEL